MNPNSLSKAEALSVEPTGITYVEYGDTIIVGVKCIVGDDGEILPSNPRLKDTVKALLDEHGKDVFFIKRKKYEKAGATNG